MSSANSAWERILDKLSETGTVRCTSTGRAMAQCPAHDDHNPSLAVTAAEGMVLVHCFAGCDSADVLAKLGLTYADLWDEHNLAGSGVARYQYPDRLVTRTVTTNGRKKFSQNIDRRRKVVRLYRLEAVERAVREHTVIYLVEGEKDVHALEVVGCVATTAPMGAGNVDKCDLSPLAGAHVVAVVDHDAAGDKWAAKVRTKLDGVSASLRFKRAAVGKDAADHVAAHLGPGDLVDYHDEGDTGGTRPSSDTSDSSGSGAAAALTSGYDTSDGSDTSTTGLLANLRNGAWLDQQTFPELRWFVPGVVPEGATELVGAPKIGKSWLALDIGLNVAAGGHALGTIRTGPPRPVLQLALEDGDRRLQGRARKLLRTGSPIGRPLPELWSYLTRIEPNMCEATIRAWLDTLNDDTAPLVILDVVGKVMPPTLPGEGAYQRDYRVVGRLKALCDERPGMGLLLLNHNRKANAEDFVETSSGTNGIAGAVDSVVVIARARTETTALLKVTGRDVEEAEYAVMMRDGRWELDGSNLDKSRQRAATQRATHGLDARSMSIVELLGNHSDGLTPAEIATKVGVDSKSIGAYLKRLHEAGRIDRPKRGLYAPHLASVSYLPLSEVSEVSEPEEPS